jgi:hypothetical protein
MMIPERVPLGPKIDFSALAESYDLTGGQIKNAIFRAASMAAVGASLGQLVTEENLVNAAEQEAALASGRKIGFC